MKSYQKLKRKLKVLTDRSWSISLDNRIKQINYLVRGRVNYFKIANMRGMIIDIDKAPKNKNKSDNLETVEKDSKKRKSINTTWS